MPGPKETRAAYLAEIARLKASLEAAREQGSDMYFSPEHIARTERALANAERVLAELDGGESSNERNTGPRRLKNSQRILAASTGTSGDAGRGAGNEGDAKAEPSTAARTLGRERSQKYIALSESTSGRFETPEQDLGIAGAFAGGVKTGVFEPFSLVGGGSETEGVDETGEKVANVIGTFVGLGISFVPFAMGSKLVLQGVGLAAKVTPPVEEFLRFTLAGTLQGVGSAESLEEVPKEAAIGLGFGLAIDGFFLARAMKGRAGDVAKVGEKIIDNGSVIPDEVVSPEILAQEIELAPTGGKSAGRLEEEFQGLRNEGLEYEHVIANLTEIHETTVRIPEIDGKKIGGFLEYVKGRFPEAQVLSRSVVGKEVSEVLIHNPTDPALRLTDAQIEQWNQFGVFEGMGVIRDGKWYQVTGEDLGPGLIQLKGVNSPVVFATTMDNVTIPISPRFFGKQNQASGRMAAMQQVLRANTQIGFTIGAPMSGRFTTGTRGITPVEGVRRGVVETADYAQARSYQDWLDANRGPILSQQGAGSIDEAALQFARVAGIKGLLEVEEGIVKNVRIFDQSSVRYVDEPPRLIGDLDAGQLLAMPDGTVLVESFQPTWKNTIIAPLRREGFTEKEIKNFLEAQAQAQSRNLETLMDDEFKAAAQASRVQFGEGCF